MWKRKEGKRFLTVHACLLLACLSFPLYVKLAKQAFSFLFGCFFHDFLHLYCPFCGGTRAISALLRLDLLEALRYNPMVVGLVAFALVLDAIAFWRLWKNKTPIYRYPRWGWIAMICLLLAFLILRNLLMIFFGVDPTGDLGPLWQNWNL